MSAKAHTTEKQPDSGCHRTVRLPAFEDDQLLPEAAQQLIEMIKDQTDQGQMGKELPPINKAEVLKKLR